MFGLCKECSESADYPSKFIHQDRPNRRGCNNPELSLVHLQLSGFELPDNFGCNYFRGKNPPKERSYWKIEERLQAIENKLHELKHKYTPLLTGM